MLITTSSLKQIRQFLKEKIGATYSSRETDSIIQIIFDHVGLNYMDSFLHSEKRCKTEIISQINEIVNEIANNRPIQYILGYTIFYDLKIKVNNNVLIPRPETEELVEMILNSNGGDQRSILDIGTGSGCIAIALKKNLPQAKVYALDRYLEALTVAGTNAKMNGTEINFMKVDFLDNPSEKINNCFDLIVSNPPYVTLSEKKLMHANVLENEPWNALFIDDSDPLQFYRAIADYAIKFLNRPGEIWLEINENFGEQVRKMFMDKGFTDCILHTDLQGKERIIHIKAE